MVFISRQSDLREERSSSILGKDEVPSSNLGSSSKKAPASKDAGAFLRYIFGLNYKEFQPAFGEKGTQNATKG